MGIFGRKKLKDPRTPEEIRAYVDSQMAEKMRVCNSDYDKLTVWEKTKEYRKKFTRMDQEIFRAALMEYELDKEFIKLEIEYRGDICTVYLHPYDVMIGCGDDLDVLACTDSCHKSIRDPKNRVFSKRRDQDWFDAQDYAVDTLGYDKLKNFASVLSYANEYIRTPASAIRKMSRLDGTVLYDREALLKQMEEEKRAYEENDRKVHKISLLCDQGELTITQNANILYSLTWEPRIFLYGDKDNVPAPVLDEFMRQIVTGDCDIKILPGRKTPSMYAKREEDKPWVYERYEGGIMYQGKCYYFAFSTSVQASIETKANDKPHGFKDMLYSEVPGPIRLKAIELIAQGACPYEAIVGWLLPVKQVHDFADWYFNLPADRPDLLEKISEPEQNKKREETKKEASRSM